MVDDVVYGPVTYDARLRPVGSEWQAEVPCCGVTVTAASPEAAEEALAEALADLREARFPTRSGMPAPQPLSAEAGWSVVSVSPTRRPMTAALLGGRPRDRDGDDEEFIELPYTPGVSRTYVDGPVCCYEAVLEPYDGGWRAREIMNFCEAPGPTPEAAKEALAVALGETMVRRRKENLPIPVPKPLRIEGNHIVGERTTVRDGWSLFTVTPKPPDRDREAKLLRDEPTLAVGGPEDPPRRTVTLGPYRNADGSVTYTTVTLGPLLSRMTGPGRTTAGGRD